MIARLYHCSISKEMWILFGTKESIFIHSCTVEDSKIKPLYDGSMRPVCPTLNPGFEVYYRVSTPLVPLDLI